MFKLIVVTPGGTRIDLMGGDGGGGSGGAGGGGDVAAADAGGNASSQETGGGSEGAVDGVTGPEGPTGPEEPAPETRGVIQEAWDSALAKVCPPPGETSPQLTLQSALNEPRDKLPFHMLDQKLDIGEYTPALPAAGERATNWLGRDTVTETDWDWVPGAKEYKGLKEMRADAHEFFPGEANSELRHSVASMVVTERYGEWTARIGGVVNEYQGLRLDLTNLCSRLTGRAPWAASFDDLVANERGINEALRRESK